MDWSLTDNFTVPRRLSGREPRAEYGRALHRLDAVRRAFRAGRPLRFEHPGAVRQQCGQPGSRSCPAAVFADHRCQRHLGLRPQPGHLRRSLRLLPAGDREPHRQSRPADGGSEDLDLRLRVQLTLRHGGVPQLHRVGRLVQHRACGRDQSAQRHHHVSALPQRQRHEQSGLCAGRSRRILQLHHARSRDGRPVARGCAVLQSRWHQDLGCRPRSRVALRIRRHGSAERAGNLALNVSFSWLDTFKTQASPGAPFLENAGTLANEGQFDWRLLTTFAIASASVDVGLTWRHLPSAHDQAFVNLPTTTVDDVDRTTTSASRRDGHQRHAVAARGRRQPVQRGSEHRRRQRAADEQRDDDACRATTTCLVVVTISV